MIEFGATKNVSPPFEAVVGQAELKEALLAVAIEPDLAGLLVRGEKGTAKSTAVRGLVDLLPEQRAVADCPYGCTPAGPDGEVADGEDLEGRGSSRQSTFGPRCRDCRTRENPPVETRAVPLVTLPLGATRERVVGSLSVADALDGESSFDPGLLARAHRGILYVDEINLLEDHLVDVLLDAAASGVNRVERDGVSVEHPAEFTLIGTMNPEEGDLRPQLRDRFALQVTVEGCRDVDDRVSIIDRALGVKRARKRTRSPPSARKRRSNGMQRTVHEEGDTNYRERLETALELLPEVELTADLKREIAELCLDAGVDGHRGDIATARGARALAALEGRPTVVESDVRRAAELALPHRLKSRPFEDAPDPGDVIEDHFDEEASDASDGDASDGDASDGDASGGETSDGETSDGESDAGNTGDAGSDAGEAGIGGPDTGDRGGGASGSDGASSSREPTAGRASGEDESNGTDDASPGSPSDEGAEATPAAPLVPGQERAGVDAAAAPDLEAPSTDGEPGGNGSRVGTRPAPGNDGAKVRTEPADADATDIDPAASVRAAARRSPAGTTGPEIQQRDLRRSVRTGTGEALVVFALDASASMRPAMARAKGVVIELLRDAYEQRDAVAVVTFAGRRADVVLPPTDSVDLAARHLKDIRTADRTPLPAGLRTVCEVLVRADPDAAAVVLVTDGRANADAEPTAETRRAARALGELGANVVVVDVGDGEARGLVPDVVERTGGERVPLEALTPERVDAAVGREPGE